MGEGYFREIVESLGAAVLIVDTATRTIVDSNPNAAALLGSPRERIAGRSCSGLLCNVGESRTPPCRDPGCGGTTEIVLVRGSGERIPVQMSVTPFAFEGKDYRIHCCVDIADKFEAEEALARANEQLKFWLLQGEIRNREITLLNELLEALQSKRSLDEALRELERAIPALFPGGAGSLGLVRSDGGTVRTVSAWGGAPRAEFPPESCKALLLEEPYMAGEGSADAGCPQSASRNPALSICVPLRPHDEPFGVIHLAFPPGAVRDLRETGRSPEALRRLAVAVAGQVGLALCSIRLREKLRLQAIRDPLTGIFNRRYMEETLRREICRSRRNGNAIGIIAAHVDGFPELSERHGRAAGDAVLKGLGKFLASRVRGSDIPCRYGGEEFALVLTDAAPEATVKRAEQIRHEAGRVALSFRGKPIPPVTLSFGVAVYPRNGETAEDILRAADSALRASREEGGIRIVVASPSAGA